MIKSYKIGKGYTHSPESLDSQYPTGHMTELSNKYTYSVGYMKIDLKNLFSGAYLVPKMKSDLANSTKANSNKQTQFDFEIEKNIMKNNGKLKPNDKSTDTSSLKVSNTEVDIGTLCSIDDDQSIYRLLSSWKPNQKIYPKDAVKAEEGVS